MLTVKVENKTNQNEMAANEDFFQDIEMRKVMKTTFQKVNKGFSQY